jgi:glycerophosphoryl diester phosphodiesterase
MLSNKKIFFFSLIILLVSLPTDSFSKRKKNRYFIKIETPEELRKIFRYKGQIVPFLSAHRGGPESHLPENCIATFSNTLKHTYAIMEIDPRYTKDGVIILHHDDTLERTTTGKGRVADYSFSELQKLKLKNMAGNVTSYKIPTLSETIKWAKGKTILVLDKKDVPIEERLKVVQEHNAESYSIIMAYTFEEAKRCYELNNDILMQIFINTPDKIPEFEKTGVPWENVVVFVSHQVPNNSKLFNLINEKGALCILGTSRNLDKELIRRNKTNDELCNNYIKLFELGADILETDHPVPVSKLLTDWFSFKTDNNHLR